jgi:tripartite-type tricarboxylate transporter receptor subunit TctC
MPYKAKITDTQSWNDIPTCKEAGLPTSYLMLRGIFMPAGVTKEQTEFYVKLFQKVAETPEWKEYMEKGAFNQSFKTGAEFTEWLKVAESTHRDLMKEAGFLSKD